MVEKNNGLLMEPINNDDKDGHNSENKKAELIAVSRQLYREKKNDNALIIKKSTMPPGVQRVLKSPPSLAPPAPPPPVLSPPSIAPPRAAHRSERATASLRPLLCFQSRHPSIRARRRQIRSPPPPIFRSPSPPPTADRARRPTSQVADAPPPCSLDVAAGWLAGARLLRCPLLRRAGRTASARDLGFVVALPPRRPRLSGNQDGDGVDRILARPSSTWRCREGFVVSSEEGTAVFTLQLIPSAADSPASSTGISARSPDARKAVDAPHRKPAVLLLLPASFLDHVSDLHPTAPASALINLAPGELLQTLYWSKDPEESNCTRFWKILLKLTCHLVLPCLLLNKS
ncbi:formin-like protein 3 [Triticum dicoccoides]|uniref:formin-like protein 3 n=1 Tax=Triticum dicoccoides TaxID=85692 RepID=UPI00188E5F6B|nr:formin-like protein 3 [Triticum dicoccoides]